MNIDIPASFRIQNGCHNCKYVFKWEEYDSGEYVYCTKLSPRPIPCNSVAMGESCFDEGPTEENEEKYNKWMEWSFKHMVYAEGICNEFQEKTDEKDSN